MSRNLLEIFQRYQPSPEFAEIMLSADPASIKVLVDKPQRYIEASAAFPRIIDKRTLYEIEEEIRKAYEVNMVRLVPHYPSALFGIDRIPDLLMETNRRGIVAKGFFDRCEYRLTSDTLKIEIPSTDGGVQLIYDAKTPQLMEEILRDEFGVTVRVEIRRMENYDPSEYQSSLVIQQRELERAAAAAEVEYHRMQQQAQSRSEASAVADLISATFSPLSLAEEAAASAVLAEMEADAPAP